MNWLQLGYQYLVGGTFFAVCVWLCFRPGGSELDNPSDRKALIYLVCGLVGYLAFHTLWILLAS